MKNNIKYALLASALVLNIQSSIAQDKFETGIHVGGKVGVNYSNVYDEKGDDFVAQGKIGFAGGAFLSVPLGTQFAIQPELLLSQKGFRATGSILGLDYEFTRTSTFIDVPVYFAWRPASYISIMAGPQFSYLIKQRDDFKSSLTSYFAEQEFNNQNLRKNILGFIGGFDFNFDNVVLGLRGGFDFQSNQGDGTSSAPRYKNTWLQATVGFRI